MKVSRLLSLLCLICVMSSCSDKSSFGFLSKKYSKDRLATFNEAYNPFYEKRKETRRPARSERTYSRNRTAAKRPAVVVADANMTAPTKVDAVALKRGEVVSQAREYVGIPYKYGGKTPSAGFDCSGFTSYVMSDKRVPVFGPSHKQAAMGVKKYKSEVEPGDLLFFGKKGKVTHVGMVDRIENNDIYMIHSSSSRGVVIDNMSGSSYWMERYMYARDVITQG